MPRTSTDKIRALEFDRRDPLAAYRNKFFIDDPFVIYLDGNSLGRLPAATIGQLDDVIENQWGKDLIGSWNESWYRKSKTLGEKISKLIGAEPDEVILSDSTSVNLYKLAYAALKYQVGKKTILTDEFNFPSDIYILQGLIQLFNGNFKLDFLKSRDGISIDKDEISHAIHENTALVTLSHVAFKSSFMYDMQHVTQIAHEQGALVLWDLSHSVGAVPVNLKECKVDLAVGCTYKYLNGGPGAPAFLYVRKDFQEKLTSPIWGWFGAANPFDFKLDYLPDTGIKKFLTGTPPITSLTAIEPGVDMILEAGMDQIRKKSVRMSEFFIALFHEKLKDQGFSLASPVSSRSRGSHISVNHNEAYRIIKALMQKSIDGYQIIPDFRSPNNIRFGFAPLYNSFLEIYITIEKLRQIVELRLYEKFDHSKPDVT